MDAILVEQPTPNMMEPEDFSGLTCIHRRIHCAATQDTYDNDELDRIAIDNFLHTLTDVDLSIAKRREPVE
jgi:hypothetical protein